MCVPQNITTRVCDRPETCWWNPYLSFRPFFVYSRVNEHALGWQQLYKRYSFFFLIFLFLFLFCFDLILFWFWFWFVLQDQRIPAGLVGVEVLCHFLTFPWKKNIRKNEEIETQQAEFCVFRLFVTFEGRRRRCCGGKQAIQLEQDAVWNVSWCFSPFLSVSLFGTSSCVSFCR